MTARPWLSVISPIFNGEAYLSSALDSIILQGDADIECIAIDGESTDATLKILRSYQDRIPLRIFQRERNTNWVSKTNYGLSLARGEYACFLHHDDLWFTDRLKTMRQLTEQFPKASLLLHPSNYLDNKGNNLGTWSCPLPAAPAVISPSMMTERLLVQNFISILGPLFKRKAALKVDYLDELLWYTADWDFWLKLASCGTSIYHPKPLSGFRIHSSSQTIVRSSGSQEFREQLEVVVTKHFARWQADEPTKRRLRAVIDFSVEVNIALASAAHGKKTNLMELLVDFVQLGPSGWYRYLWNSRIWERVSARIKARVKPFKRL